MVHKIAVLLLLSFVKADFKQSWKDNRWRPIIAHYLNGKVQGNEQVYCEKYYKPHVTSYVPAIYTLPHYGYGNMINNYPENNIYFNKKQEKPANGYFKQW